MQKKFNWIALFLLGALAAASLMAFRSLGNQATGVTLLSLISGIIVGFNCSLRHAQTLAKEWTEEARIEYLAELNERRAKLQADYDDFCAELKETERKYDKASEDLKESCDFVGAHYDVINRLIERLTALRDCPEAAYDSNAYREKIDAEILRFHEEASAIKMK